MISIADLCKNYQVIMIDTSSFMYPNAIRFFIGVLLPELKLNDARVNIYSAVVGEIKNHVISNDNDRQWNAKNAEVIVNALSLLNRVEYIQRPGRYADDVFIQEIKAQMDDHSILLITQDRGLFSRIAEIKKQKSPTSSTDIKICWIDYGKLKDWENGPLLSHRCPNSSLGKYSLFISEDEKTDITNCPLITYGVPEPNQAQKSFKPADQANRVTSSIKIQHKTISDIKEICKPNVSTSSVNLAKSHTCSSNFLEGFLRRVGYTFSHHVQKTGG